MLTVTLGKSPRQPTSSSFGDSGLETYLTQLQDNIAFEKQFLVNYWALVATDSIKKVIKLF